MVNVMPMVGSSIWICGSGFGVSALVMVSPIVMPSTPAIASMSPGLRDGFVHALQAFERVELGDAGLLDRAIELGRWRLHRRGAACPEDAADGEPPEIIAVIEIRDQRLQDGVRIARRAAECGS